MSSILIVDDAFYQLQLASIYLNKQGFSVSKATGRIDALSKINIKAPDIVFIDVLTSNKSTIDLCHFLKHNLYTQSLPLVVAHSSKDQVYLQSIQQNVDVLLPKPFGFNDLNWAIGFALKISKSKNSSIGTNRVNSEDFLGILNHLKSRGEMVLGKKLVAKYLELSRPGCEWLKQFHIESQSITFSRQSQVVLNELQIMGAKQWVNAFICQCSHVIKDFSKMLDRSLIYKLDQYSQQSVSP